jgi:hypothetical protein
VPEPAPPAPGVPGYEVLGELGRGGMGVVYQARQVSLNRVVALKMVSLGPHLRPEQRAALLARFRAEAEAVARLQHPHIVQIFEVGEHGGLPFFSLEFCEGGSLARLLGGKPQPAAAAAGQAELLARAVAYAHERGIVHRDLKPDNVLLAGDGQPKLTDFGLAKYLEDEPGAARMPTRDGQVLGSPSYMAPEQARGQARMAGPAADVYALGAILYEMLTGRPPFLAATPLETVRQVADEEPVPPRRLQPGVPRDLETACLKCLEKEPKKRYASAQALAEDLRRFREGRPIGARPVGRVGRGWRWCRRNPLPAALLALLALTLAGGFSAVTALWLRAARQARRAEVSVGHDRRMMHDYFARVSGDLRLQQPGARPLRKEMAEAALAYLTDYQAVLREQGDDPGTRAELSRTYWCMGELMRLLGPADDALPNLKQAAALQEQLLAADPGDARLREDLAHSYASLGNLHNGRGRHEEALRSLPGPAAGRGLRNGPLHPVRGQGQEGADGAGAGRARRLRGRGRAGAPPGRRRRLHGRQVAQREFGFHPPARPGRPPEAAGGPGAEVGAGGGCGRVPRRGAPGGTGAYPIQSGSQGSEGRSGVGC